MHRLIDFLNYDLELSKTVHITVYAILVVLVVLFITRILLKLLRKFITRKMPEHDKAKFTSFFSFARWFLYVIILLITLHNMGINVTGIFAASAALLVGIGLALQTFFQDIISGVFILVDQSVHVGDIVELDGKVGRVVEIRLRTTRAVTFNNKVMIIPNHLYLTNHLFNWTENGAEVRDWVDVGVAYGSDVQLVKKVLLQAVREHPKVREYPEPRVLFTDFGDSSLNFRVAFTVNDGFEIRFIQSDIRFEIDRLFRENNITIPFPQRDVHLITKTENGNQLSESTGL